MPEIPEHGIRVESQCDSSKPKPSCNFITGDLPSLTKPEKSRIQALSGEVAALSEAAKLSRLVTVITFQSEGLEEG